MEEENTWVERHRWRLEVVALVEEGYMDVDVDVDVPLLEEVLILLEVDTDTEISKAEKKALNEDLDGTGVRLYTDKDGRRSFATRESFVDYMRTGSMYMAIK